MVLELVWELALELVVAELADPQSGLQHALQSATDDRASRIWCPEAEGPPKGPHRTRAAARVRQGTAARLRQAKQMC